MKIKRPNIRKELRLTGKTAVSQSDREGKGGASLREEGLVLLLSCLFSTLVLRGLLLNYCLVWKVPYQQNWTFSLFVISLAAAMIFAIGKHFWIVPWITAVLLAVNGVRSILLLAEGAKELANPVLRTWHAYYGTRLSVYTLDAESQMEYVVFYFAAWLAFLMIGTIYKKGGRLFLVLPALAMISMTLIVGLSPNMEACICLCAGILPALALSREGIFESDSELRVRIGIGNSVLAFGMFLLGLGLFIFWGNYTIAPAILKKHDVLLTYQKNLENQIVEFASNIKGGFSLFGGGTGNGEITNDRLRYTGKEIFRVTMEKKPEAKFYFRGFVGETYSNGQWIPMGEEDFAAKLAEWEYDEGDAGQFILNRSYERAQEVAAYTSNVMGDSSFFPADENGDNVGFLTEMEITYGKRSGTYAFLPYYTDLYKDALSDFTVERDAVIKRPEETTQVRFETAEIISDAGVVEFGGSIPVRDDESKRRLLWQYGLDAKETYTKVPSVGLNRLLELADTWKERGYGVESYDINYAIPIEKVTLELAGRTDYSKTPGRLPDGVDVVEYFLFDNKLGYCTHYASTATLLLRRLGVPARYVSGYAVEPEDFEKNSDGTFTAVVNDEMGHAWVEVYTEGKGWIPIEVTEGVRSMGYGMEEESLRMADVIRSVAKEQEKETEDERVQLETEHMENQNTQMPAGVEDGMGEEEEEGMRAMQFLFLVLLVILLVAATIILIYRAGRYVKHELRFRSKNTKVALLEVMHRIVSESYRAGFIKEKNLTDEEFLRVADKSLNFLWDGELEIFFKTVQKSEFSNYVPTEAEVESGKRLYQNLMVAVKNRKNAKNLY